MGTAIFTQRRAARPGPTVIALALAVILVVVFGALAPQADAPPIAEARWERHFHSLELDIAGRPFRWMGPTAWLTLPRLSTAPQRLTLRMQNARADGLAVPLGLTGLVSADLTVLPGERTYALLVPETIAPTPDGIRLVAGAVFRPEANDKRLLSVVMRGAAITPLGPGLPWWSATALALLAQTALVVLLLRSQGARGWALLLAAAFVAAQLPWLLGGSGYGPGAAVTTWGVAAMLAGVVVLAPRRTIHPEQAVQPAAWARADYLLAGGIAVGGLALRAALVQHQLVMLNGDDYLTGSFAANIAQRGWHALYFGSHTGALAAYLAVPAFVVGGVSVTSMMALPLALTGVLTVALYGLGRDLAGRWGGAAAALAVALPAATPLWWTMKPQPGYLEAITFAALALWGSVRLLWGEERGRGTAWLMAGAAASAVLAVWAGMVVASVLLTCGALVLLRWRRALELPLVGYAAAVALGLLLAVPTAYYIATRPGDNPLWWIVGREKTGLAPPDAFAGLITELLPLTLGAVRPHPMPPLPTAGAVLVLAVAGLSLLYALYVALRGARAALVPVGITLFVTLLFCFSSFNTLLTDARYVLPLYLALPLLLGLAVAAVARRLGGWTGAGTLAAVVALYAWSGPGGMLAVPPQRPPEEALARELLARDLRYVHSGYWLAHPLMVHSGGQILASAQIGPTRVTYDQRVDGAVAAADPAEIAYVMQSDSIILTPFEDELMAQGIICRREQIAIFIVFSACSAPPDLDALQHALPFGPT